MAPDHRPLLADLEHRPGGVCLPAGLEPDYFRAQHHQAPGVALAAEALGQERVRAGPGVVGPDLPLGHDHRPVPVDEPVGLLELLHKRRRGVVLRHLRRQRVAVHEPQRLGERVAAGDGEVVHQRAAGGVGIDWLETLEHDRPVVQPRAHVHHRHPGQALARLERGHHRRRATVLGEQREVAVDAAEERQVEERLLEDLAVGDDRDHVRPPLAQPRHRLRVVDAVRLEDVGDAVLRGKARHRVRRERLAAPGGAVRLGDDADHFELRFAQDGAKALDRGRRRTHEDYAHPTWKAPLRRCRRGP